MTVLTTQSLDEAVTQYDANGKQTYFEYGFELISGTTIAVFLKNKRIFNFEQRAKGIIIKPAPTGRLVIVRQLVIDQLRNFEAFDSFNAEWTEAAMDKLILLKQEAAEYRAFMNLTAAHYTSFVKITNDKGADADIYLWNGRNDEGVPIPPTPPPTDPANPPRESYLLDLAPSLHIDWQSVPNPPNNQATIELMVHPNGQITAWHEHGGEPPEYPEAWNNAAPLLDNPENFEARMTHIDGRRQLYWYENGSWWYFAGQDSTPWLNISDMAKFRYTAKTNLQVEDTVIIAGDYQLEVREVGKPETVKIKRMDLRLWIQT